MVRASNLDNRIAKLSRTTGHCRQPPAERDSRGWVRVHSLGASCVTPRRVSTTSAEPQALYKFAHGFMRLMLRWKRYSETHLSTCLLFTCSTLTFLLPTVPLMLCIKCSSILCLVLRLLSSAMDTATSTAMCLVVLSSTWLHSLTCRLVSGLTTTALMQSVLALCLFSLSDVYT